MSGFIACCQRCDRLCYQHGAARQWQVVTLIAGSKRRSLLTVKYDDEMFMTRSLNVTPKTTKAFNCIRSDKSVAYVTNNKKLYSTFCTIEATDRHEASRGLFATAELLVTKLGEVTVADKALNPQYLESIRQTYGSGPGLIRKSAFESRITLG